MGFGIDRPHRHGPEAWPDRYNLPPVVRIRFEEPTINGQPTGRYVLSDGSRRIEIFLSEFFSELGDTLTKQFKEAMQREAYARLAGKWAQFAVGQRDNMDRPQVGNMHHKRRDDADMTLDYYSHMSMSRLEVLIKSSTVADLFFRVLFSSKLDFACMYIFHDMNKITLVTMKSVDAGTPKRIARVTQTRAGWSGEPLKTTQLPMGGGLSVIMSPLRWERQSRNFLEESTYQFTAVSSRPRTAGNGQNYTGSSERTTRPALMAGSDGVFHTSNHSGTVLSAPLLVSLENVDSDLGPPILVDASGTRFYAVIVESKAMRQDFRFQIYDESGGEAFRRLPGEYSSQYVTKVDELRRREEVQSDITYYAPATTAGAVASNRGLTFDYTLLREEYRVGTSTEKKELRIPVPHAVWDQSVSVQIGSLEQYVDIARLDRGAYNETYRVNLASYFASGTVSGGDHGTPVKWEQAVWPPSYTGMLWLKNSAEGEFFRTDYGSFSRIKSWLHVANENHLCQAIEGDGSRHMYFPAVGEGRLASLANTSLESIQSVFLDTPLRLVVSR